ncbi:uncharacterized protein LOC143019435 [Oratosquilla oratoria]|uniref:uncharacterized protein LOC143019435 n=1 Tax=Oratosquilla oratoria TaxID=337810 RepID=UPI003F76AECA
MRRQEKVQSSLLGPPPSLTSSPRPLTPEPPSPRESLVGGQPCDSCAARLHRIDQGSLRSTAGLVTILRYLVFYNSARKHSGMRMEGYKPGDLAALIAGAQSEETKEDFPKSKEKNCKAEDNEEIMTPKRKKKRKSIVEDNAIRDIDTTPNATPAKQKQAPKDDGAPVEEASATEAERTSTKKKKKKRKSIVEDENTAENDAPPNGQDCKHEENGIPEEASAPEAERTPKKKKKRKSIVEESTTDVDAAQNVAAPVGKEEDRSPPEEASAPQAERTSPKKKKKKRNSIMEDGAVDLNTTQDGATAEGQNFKHKENGVPAEETSVPETETTSPKKKKKKRKSIVEDNAVDVDTVQTTATPDEQTSKQEEDGIPPEEASAPEAEKSSKKKKKRKSIIEDSNKEDLDMLQKNFTLEMQNCKQEEECVPPEEASPPEAKTPKKKKKKRKSIMEDSITEDLDVAQTTASMEGQKNCKHEDGAPEKASAPEAESVLSKEKTTAEDVSGATEENRDEIRKDEKSLVRKENGVKEDPTGSSDAKETERTSKKKKRKSIVGDSAPDVNTTQSTGTPTGQKRKQEDDGANASEAERTSKKKKRKSTMEDSIIEDLDVLQNNFTQEGQNCKQEVSAPPEETSPPEAKSPKKKKKKRKSVMEDSITEDLDVAQTTASLEGQNFKHEDGAPPKEASAPEAESIPSKKEKNEKEATEDIRDTTEENQNAVKEDVTLATNEVGENEEPTESTDAKDTKSAPSKKKRKRNKKKKKGAKAVSGATEENGNAVEAEVKEGITGSTDAMEAKSDGTQDVGEQGSDEEAKGDVQEDSSKEPDGEDTSQQEAPKEVSSSGLKPSKKKLKPGLQNKVTTGKKSQNNTPAEDGKDFSKQPNGKDENMLTAPENKKSNPKNDKDTPGKLDLKEKKKLTGNDKKLEKQKRITESIKNSLPTKHPEAEERTIFVGNVGIKTKRKMLAQFFTKYGKVETVRLRNVSVASPNMSKKEAVVKGMFHPKRTSLNAYIRFKDKESVEKALEANGVEFQEHHLIVNKSKKDAQKRPENTVFIGNLPWEAEEESLYKHFSDCGAIESVRIIRDKKLGSGKGFGYVNFKSRDAQEVALQLSGKEFEGRALRVKRAVKKVKSKNDFGTKQKERVLPGQHPKMKLNFMKKTKGKQLEKEEFARKQKKIDFSGVKTSEEPLKKGKRMKFSKDDKRKAFIAQKLTGDGSSTGFGGPKSKRFPKSASSKPIKNDE